MVSYIEMQSAEQMAAELRRLEVKTCRYGIKKSTAQAQVPLFLASGVAFMPVAVFEGAVTAIVHESNRPLVLRLLTTPRTATTRNKDELVKAEALAAKEMHAALVILEKAGACVHDGLYS